MKELSKLLLLYNSLLLLLLLESFKLFLVLSSNVKVIVPLLEVLLSMTCLVFLSKIVLLFVILSKELKDELSDSFSFDFEKNILNLPQKCFKDCLIKLAKDNKELNDEFNHDGQLISSIDDSCDF